MAEVRPDVVVTSVISFETLPESRGGIRQATVRWSDASQGVALRWYPDEILISEGDLLNKTLDEIRSLHFRRDRDWLNS